jgi:hypothetical protein
MWSSNGIGSSRFWRQLQQTTNMWPEMNTRLPDSPNFNKLEANAADSARQRTQIMALIGNLVFSWSNNESVFIYVLMELLNTDFQSAAVTFISLNTTRARLDHIRRLAKISIKDDKLRRRLERLIERFNDCTKVRNEFNHCIYQVDDGGNITHTHSLRVTEKKGELQLGEIKAFDDRRYEEINRTIRKLTVLNRDLWSYLPELEGHMKDLRVSNKIG